MRATDDLWERFDRNLARARANQRAALIARILLAALCGLVVMAVTGG